MDAPGDLRSTDPSRLLFRTSGFGIKLEAMFLNFLVTAPVVVLGTR